MANLLGVFAATPTPAATTDPALAWNPVFWVSIICALSGLTLLVFDGLVRMSAAKGAGDLAGLVKETLEVSIAQNASDPEGQAKILEAKAAAQSAIDAYKQMFLKFPQLVVGATLLVIPLLIAGGVSFGVT